MKIKNDVITNSESLMNLLRVIGIIDENDDVVLEPKHWSECGYSDNNDEDSILHDIFCKLLHGETGRVFIDNEKYKAVDTEWEDEIEKLKAKIDVQINRKENWEERSKISEKYIKKIDSLVEEFKAEHDIQYEHLEQEGGSEGDGERVHGVFRVGDDYFRADWTYYSHYGYGDEFDGDSHNLLYKVEPRVITKTIYS